MTLRYNHLKGFEFDMDRRHCYTLARDFYRDNYDIHLPDYANPTAWWFKGLDLYIQLAHDEGFKSISTNPREWLPGDLIIMSISSERQRTSVGNHVGIVVDGGQILHHLVGQRSCVTAYGGTFRNNTVAALRHPDVAKRTPAPAKVDLTEVLPSHVAARLQRLRDRRAADGAAGAGS